MDNDIRLSVEEVWNAFTDAFCTRDIDPFNYWVPEIRDIQKNCEEWWRSMLRSNLHYPIVKFEVLPQGHQGIFGVRFERGINEFGFIQKDEHILLTSAKSLRLLDNLSNWFFEESENFIFLYADNQQVSHCAIQQSEEVYHRLLECLKIPPNSELLRSEKVKYALCHDARVLRSLTGIPVDNESGLTDPVSLTIVSTRLADVHEIAHAVATKHIGGASPLAYREGFAESFIRPQGWEKFLNTPFQQPSVFSNLSPTAFYQAPAPWAQAGGFCKYILHNFGTKLLKDIYRHTNRYTFRAYILKKTGQSVDELVVKMQRTAMENPAVFEAWELIPEPRCHSSYRKGGPK